MTNQPSRSAKGYDFLGPIYHWLEWVMFGRQLHRSRIALIDHLTTCQRALILGDGDGRLLVELCDRLPDCLFVSIDHSQTMLDLQRRRLKAQDQKARIEFIESDLRDYQPIESQFDLVVAAYVLDCFTEDELQDHLPRWLGALRPGGLFYFVDFVHLPSGWRKMQSTVYQILMHSLFRAITALPNDDLLDIPGFLDKQPLALVNTAQNIHPMMTCRIYQKTDPHVETEV